MKPVKLPAGHPALKRAMAKAGAARAKPLPAAAAKLAAALKEVKAQPKAAKQCKSGTSATVKDVEPPKDFKSFVFLPVLELQGHMELVAPAVDLRVVKDDSGKCRVAHFKSRAVQCYVYQAGHAAKNTWLVYADFKKCLDKDLSPFEVAELLAARLGRQLTCTWRNPDLQSLFENSRQHISPVSGDDDSE